MATHTSLPIYKAAYELLGLSSDMVKNMNRDYKRTIGEKIAMECIQIIPAEDLHQAANSYFGLLRQSTHSHHDRALLANEVRYRGHSIKGDLTKTYRKSA